MLQLNRQRAKIKYSNGQNPTQKKKTNETKKNKENSEMYSSITTIYVMKINDRE